MKITRMKHCCGLLMALIIYIGCGESSTSQSDQKLPQSELPRPKAQPVIKTTNKLGKRMFLLCTACHSLKKGLPHKTGPNLHGIFGAKAGEKPGFKYSDALLNSGIVWDEDHIRKWLKEPATYIPGTAMAFVGIEDEEQQTALIEFLKEQTK